MKIRKAFQGTVPENKILDTYSTSQTDTYGCNYINKLGSYSTTEVKTGKTWLGKPIYSKVLDIGSYNWTNGANVFNHNVSNFDVLVDLDYVMQWTNNNWYKNWDHLDNGNWVANSTGITMYCTSVTYFKQVYLIIEYTKTTD